MSARKELEELVLRGTRDAAEARVQAELIEKAVTYLASFLDVCDEADAKELLAEAKVACPQLFKSEVVS